MSGPINTPLTVTDTDGSPSIRPCRTITFDSTDFTVVDNGSGNARIVASASGGSTLTDSYVGFGDAANLLTGSSKLTWSETSELLTITCSDNTDALVIKSTDSDANVGPIFTLFRDEGAPGSTDDFLGQITFKGNDSAENTTTYASINSYIIDATNTTEDALIWFSVMTNGTEREKLRIINNQVEVNAIARDDCDFRVRASGVSDLLFCDSSAGNVGIGSTPGANTERLHIMGSGGSANGMVRIESLESGTTDGPVLDLFRNKTGEASQYMGNIRFISKDDGDNVHNFGQIRCYIADKVAGSADSLMEFRGLRNDVDISILELYSYRATFNPSKRSDVDFRVSTDNLTDAFFVDAGNDNIGIGALPAANAEDAGGQFQVLVQNETGYGVHINRNKAGSAMDSPLVFIKDDSQYADETVLHVEGDGTTGQTIGYFKGVGTGDSVVISSTAAGSSDDAPNLVLYRETVGVDDTFLGALNYRGQTLDGTAVEYAEIRAYITDPSNSSEDCLFQFRTAKAGAMVEQMRMRESGVVFNEDANSGLDFRIESVANNSMFKVDSGLNKVSVSGAPVATGATFQVPNNTISSYANVTASTTSPMTLTNDDLQSQFLVHTAGTALTVNLPLDGGIKGQYFRFVSTSGDVTIVPSAVSGDTINGGTGSLTRSTNNEIYDCLCIATSTWILSNPA